MPTAHQQSNLITVNRANEGAKKVFTTSIALGTDDTSQLMEGNPRKTTQQNIHITDMSQHGKQNKRAQTTTAL